jgi:hypothetical protein
VKWNRATVAAAFAATLEPAVGVKVHQWMPEILNPYCLVVNRPVSVNYGAVAFGADEGEVPVVVVGGVETEPAIDALKMTARDAVEADPTLGGAVTKAWPILERNWLNRVGAGGLQLLTVDLVFTVVT